MATITSRLPALIDYLVNLFTNASTLGQASPAVRIFDGPAPSQDYRQLQLWVGVNHLDNAGAQEAGSITQEWKGLGRQARDETSTIRCVAHAWSGDTNFQVQRQAAAAIVAAVETLMQQDTTQFGGNVLYPAPGVTTGTLTQASTGDGTYARIAFDITFKSRIGGF